MIKLTISAFPYRSGKFTRKHGPVGYKEHGSFKPWLRDEYSFRCVYCLFREAWFPFGPDSFHIDHFIATVEGGQRVIYDNLFYACEKCNRVKNRKTGLLNPDEHGYGDHIRQNYDGRVEALTPYGNAIIDLLKLNAEQRVVERAKMLAYVRVAGALDKVEDQEIRETLLQILTDEFGYPNILPDLKKDRPPGNTKPTGILESHHAKMSRGELDLTY